MAKSINPNKGNDAAAEDSLFYYQSARSELSRFSFSGSENPAHVCSCVSWICLQSAGVWFHNIIYCHRVLRYVSLGGRSQIPVSEEGIVRYLALSISADKIR